MFSFGLWTRIVTAPAMLKIRQSVELDCWLRTFWKPRKAWVTFTICLSCTTCGITAIFSDLIVPVLNHAGCYWRMRSNKRWSTSNAHQSKVKTFAQSPFSDVLSRLNCRSQHLRISINTVIMKRMRSSSSTISLPDHCCSRNSAHKSADGPTFLRFCDNTLTGAMSAKYSESRVESAHSTCQHFVPDPVIVLLSLRLDLKRSFFN